MIADAHCFLRLFFHFMVITTDFCIIRDILYNIKKKEDIAYVYDEKYKQSRSACIKR